MPKDEGAFGGEKSFPTHLLAYRRFSSCSHTVRKETAANVLLPFRDLSQLIWLVEDFAFMFIAN